MIYLVRHAHADWSPDERRPLSPAGRLAAARVADRLAPLGISAIYSSPSTRVVETVQPLATRLGLAIQLDPDLRERELALGRVADFDAAVEATWRDFAFAYPGGESNAAAQARMRAAVTRIAAAHDAPVAIASHGNAIALFLRTLDAAVDFSFWSRLSMPDIYEVRPDHRFRRVDC